MIMPHDVMIMPLPTSNLSSSLNITPNPITPRFITPYSLLFTHLYQTGTHHWDHVYKDEHLIYTTLLYSTAMF